MIDRPFRRSALLLAAAAIILSAAVGARGADVEYQTWFDYNAGWKTKSGLTRSGSGRGWYSPFSVEAFFQFDDSADERFGEQARITAGIARAFNPRLRVELDLLWQKTEQLFDLYSDNELYLRVRVFQAL